MFSEMIFINAKKTSLAELIRFVRFISCTSNSGQGAILPAISSLTSDVASLIKVRANKTFIHIVIPGSLYLCMIYFAKDGLQSETDCC